MRGANRLFAVMLVALSSALIVSPVHAEENESVTEAGDYVQLLVPLGGYIGAWVAGDKQGAFQLTKAITAAGITTHVFKNLGERMRPDASDSVSFPSGHTQAAFSGAEFIRIRYGNAWGTPAYLGALFVAYSRVQGNKHFADDVLAGASNALLWNWYFTSPLSETIDLQPVVLKDGYKINFRYELGSQSKLKPDYTRKANFRFDLEFGPVSQDKNLFAAPSATGTVIDLATAENEIDTTSRVTFQHFFRPRHEWEAYLAPMELIEFDSDSLVPEPILFADTTFVPTGGSEFRSRYNFIEARALYRYSVVDSERWAVKLGGGLQYTNTYLLIEQYDVTGAEPVLIEDDHAETHRVNALASGRVDFNFNEKWGLRYEIDGTVGGDSYINNAILLNWRPSPEWHFSIGSRWMSWEVDTTEVKNEFENGDLIFKVGHSFF